MNDLPTFVYAQQSDLQKAERLLGELKGYIEGLDYFTGQKELLEKIEAHFNPPESCCTSE